MKYIGLDVHKQYLVAAVTDSAGNVLGRDRVSTDRAAVREYFSGLGEPDELMAVMEAGFGWGYLHDELEGLVGKVKLAHPLKTRAIAEARIKTDTIDATTLAHLLRSDLVAEAYAPPFETRDKKHLLRHRASLMKFRTMTKNKVHSVLHRNHIEDPGFNSLTDKFGKKGFAYLRSFELKGGDAEILNRYLDLIETLGEMLKEVDKKIAAEFEEDETCKLLASIPGIGKLSAMIIRYEIDDITRFIHPGKLCSYAGLVPSTYSSGGKTYQGRITKQGNRWLRWIMVEAAQRAVIHDPWLRSRYIRIAKKKDKNKATVATARRLLEIVYRVWTEKRPYNTKPVAVAL